jgi:hypothetical protein
LKGDGSIATRASDAERAVVVKAPIVRDALEQEEGAGTDQGEVHQVVERE